MTERITSRPGTNPLQRPGSRPLDGAPSAKPTARETGALPAAAPRVGDVAADNKKVDIEDVTIPDLKVTTAVNGVDKPAEEKENKGFWGGLWGSVSSVATKAWGTVKDVGKAVGEGIAVAADVVGAGVTETAQSLAEGQGLLDSLGDGVKASGKKLYNDVIDPTLDKSVLGEDNEFQDKAAGALGPILTNRLAVGESVDIRIEAGATIPTELIGAPNVKVDGGGTMKVKRVLAVDANNQPIIDPATGKQETRLEVELKLDGKVGGAYSASVGFESTAQAGRYDVGLKAKAEAEAEAGLTGSVTLKMRFNPDSAQEMGNLGAMMKATAATGAAAAIPGIGLAFAAMSADDYKRSMESLPQHLESFSGEGGLYAQANASASAQVGVFARKDSKALIAGEKDGAGKIENLARSQASEKAAEAEEAVLDNLKFSLADASVGLGGDVKVGASKNFRTGENTISVSASGSAQASASVLGMGGGGKVTGDRKLDFVMDKNGELKGINIQQKLTKEEFLALRSTVEDVYGRPVDEGAIARMGSSDTITVNYQVKPEVLARMKARVASHDPAALAEAAKSLLGAAFTADRYTVNRGDIVATHRDEFALRAGGELSLGAQIGIRGGVVLGHEQEAILDRG